jgi:hypothetical protein
MMGYSLFHIDPEKEDALDAAREELAAAEDDWARLEQATDAALARAATLDRRRALLEDARRLLGRTAPGGRPQDALRSLLVPAVSARETAQRLHASLESVGVELGGEDLDPEELALIAEAWPDEAAQVAGRREAALAERATLEAERDSLRTELHAAGLDGDATDPVEAAAVAPDPEELRLERLAEARADVAAAERRQAARAVLEERRVGLAADLARADEVGRAAIAAAAGAEAELAAARAEEASLAERAGALQEQLTQADREVAEADAALGKLSGGVPDLDSLLGAIDAAEARLAEAVSAVELEDRALAALDAEGRAAALEIERLQDIVTAQGTGTAATPAEELEWYLLARLAAQRSVSVAGSVPLLLDDAMRGLEGDEVAHLLGRLERMAEAVQVIVVSDDPIAASWAEEAGPARAAVVSPGPG